MRKILKLTAFLALFATANFADEVYIFTDRADLKDPSSKEVVGMIYEGTPVKIIKDDGENSLIEISGEISSVDEKTLALKESPIFTFLTLNEKKAEPTMQFLISNDDLTDDSVEAWDEVELLYYDTCTSCHAAHKPKEHLADEWDAYISAMQDFAKITDDEKERMLRFMQAHASDGVFKEE